MGFTPQNSHNHMIKFPFSHFIIITPIMSPNPHTSTISLYTFSPVQKLESKILPWQCKEQKGKYYIYKEEEWEGYLWLSLMEGLIDASFVELTWLSLMILFPGYQLSFSSLYLLCVSWFIISEPFVLQSSSNNYVLVVKVGSFSYY